MGIWDDRAAARAAMVERQLAGRGIRDPGVLQAMRRVPRQAFVPKALREFAYDDTPLPIEAGQTISQPYIVGLMAQAAEIRAGDRVLEIGTGSGYAAAVLAEIASHVHTVEREPALAQGARRRLEELGYRNIDVHEGDGTLGLPEHAPFQAILAAAWGPDVPPSWRGQLAIGGRLVMPVGPVGRQRLLKLTRRGKDEYEEEDLGAVAFVPLIGEQGGPGAARSASPGAASSRKSRGAGAARPPGLGGRISESAEPLPDFDTPAFGALFDRYAAARVVLLGEATHGTSEFYRARAAITRRLIERHGFTIVAVEADWPDAAAIDRYVRHRPAQPGAEPPFRRFPSWMWRNAEVEAFVEWLRRRNESVPPARRAGFYGLDMYSLSTSIAAVLDYLDRVDPEAAAVARRRYGCLEPWQQDPAVYGRAVLNEGYGACEEGVVAQLRELLAKRLEYAGRDGGQFLDAAQNARLVAAAERYYRVMYYGSAQSWNLRDTHMFDTLEHLLAAHGPRSRAVVWAHNSHIGNAAATEMGRVRDELSVGQLCRERFGHAAALLGFGTYAGTVAAAADWDGPMEIKPLRPAREDSYEYQMHQAGMPRFLLDLGSGRRDGLRAALSEPRLERFVGVVYRPETELHSHYAEATLPEQFDGYVWFDQTVAVIPLASQLRAGIPQTYPFGL